MNDGIGVTYNNIFIILMRLKHECIASVMFMMASINTLNANHRLQIANFISGVETSNNRFVRGLGERMIGTAQYRRWLAIGY